MRWKKTKLVHEFYHQMDIRLMALALVLDALATRYFGQELMVTEILRTPEEQAKYYPDNPNRPSHHLARPVRAIDIRNVNLKPETKAFLKKTVTETFPEFDYLENDRGDSNPHIHIEIDNPKHGKG